MRVLLMTTDYPPSRGGVATYYENLIKHWPEADRIFVWHKLIKARTGKYFVYFFDLLKNYRRHKIDYLLVGQILPLGSVAWFFSRFFKTRYAVFLHGMDFTYALKTPRHQWLAKNILRGADKLIIGNEYTANLIRKFLPELAPKCAVINPGVSWPAGINPEREVEAESQLRAAYHLENKIIIFGLGRLVKRKGFDEVISALDLLPPDAAANLVYLIGGSGEEEADLKKLAYGRDNIIFLGALSEADKWTWLKLCDIFIMTSRNLAGDFEGFGIVYMEAALCGKPVLAGRAGGAGEAVIDGRTGLLADPEDPKDIRLKIMELAQNPELRARLGEAGKKRAAEFSWERQINKIYELIKSGSLKL